MRASIWNKSLKSLTQKLVTLLKIWVKHENLRCKNDHFNSTLSWLLISLRLLHTRHTKEGGHCRIDMVSWNLGLSCNRSPQDDVTSHLHGVDNKPQKVTHFRLHHHRNDPKYNPFCMDLTRVYRTEYMPKGFFYMLR